MEIIEEWKWFNPREACNEVFNQFNMPQYDMYTCMIEEPVVDGDYGEDGCGGLPNRVKLLIFSSEMSIDERNIFWEEGPKEPNTLHSKPVEAIVLVQLEEQYNGQWETFKVDAVPGDELKELIAAKLRELRVIPI